MKNNWESNFSESFLPPLDSFCGAHRKCEWVIIGFRSKMADDTFTPINTHAPAAWKFSLAEDVYTFRESHKSLLNIGQRRKNIIASKQTQEKRRSFHHVYSKEISKILRVANDVMRMAKPISGCRGKSFMCISYEKGNFHSTGPPFTFYFCTSLECKCMLKAHRKIFIERCYGTNLATHQPSVVAGKRLMLGLSHRNSSRPHNMDPIKNRFGWGKFRSKELVIPSACNREMLGSPRPFDNVLLLGLLFAGSRCSDEGEMRLFIPLWGPNYGIGNEILYLCWDAGASDRFSPHAPTFENLWVEGNGRLTWKVFRLHCMMSHL